MENIRFGTQRSFAVILLVASLFIFLEAYYYHGRIQNGNMPRAEVIAKITSFFWQAIEPQKSGMRESSWSLSEGKAVMLTHLSALILVIISACLVWWGRRSNGRSELDLPLVTASVLIAFGIVVTAIQTGGFIHA